MTGRVGEVYMCSRCRARAGVRGAQGGPWVERAHFWLAQHEREVEASAPAVLGSVSEPAAHQQLQPILH